MRKWIFLICLQVVCLFPSATFGAGKALLISIDSAIGPATQDYVERGLTKAAEKKVSLVILQLNTPGGLETAMRGINEAIITSPIPVVAYVAPAGARAASAGTFILYASHIAAMAPGTNVGAASPINLGAAPEDSKKLSTAEKKAMNDAAAYIRSLAQLRNRNAEWADQAVRLGVSISATEAKRLNVIDVIANDYPQLFEKINGYKVTVQGQSKTIDTKNLQIEKLSTDWRHDFLSFLTNPNIAYILMLIAMYGIFFELSNPGLILPGVVGLIALILILYAFQLMPINYVGLSLIIIGVAFMILEVYVSSFGALGIGGVIAFIIGSIMLFDTQDPLYRLDWTLVFTMSGISLIFFFMLVSLAVKSHKKAVVTGREGLIGKEGLVLNVMNQQVIVRVLGEIWEARSTVMVEPGQKIRVIDLHGLILVVEPLESEHKKSGD